MLDREGFRPNVGIVLLNARNQVFWGKRLRTHSWQFPQGGINHGESPEQAMLRELHEEIGLMPEHVQILARTRDWLRYEVPDHFIRKDARGLANYSAAETRLIARKPSSQIEAVLGYAAGPELIHRDNLVLST